MPKAQLGAQLYTCRDSIQSLEGVAETFAKIAAMGYTGVQISGMGPVDEKQVAKIAADNGLEIAGTHIGWPRFLNELDGVIETHKLWKCKHPVTGSLPHEYRTADGVKRFLDELGPVAEKLASEGMDISYHNHSEELAHVGENGETWLGMLYDLGSPSVIKAEIDTYWIQHGGGDPAQWVRRCAGRAPLLHLKDLLIMPDREQRYAEIGEGNMNWPPVFEAASAAGVEWYLVEQDECYDRSPLESLEISCQNLKAMGLG